MINKGSKIHEKGALKCISSFRQKPLDMEARIKTAYKLFADGAAEKAYQILDDLHSEIEGLSNEIKPIITEIR